MSSFLPVRRLSREVLLHYFFLKKTALESHQLLVKAYDDRASTVHMCEKWFLRVKDGDFSVEDKDNG